MNETHSLCLSDLTTELEREIKQPLDSHFNATEEKQRVSEHLEEADLAWGAVESFPVQVMLEPNSEGWRGLTYVGWNTGFQVEKTAVQRYEAARRKRGNGWKVEHMKASRAQRHPGKTWEWLTESKRRSDWLQKTIWVNKVKQRTRPHTGNSWLSQEIEA